MLSLEAFTFFAQTPGNVIYFLLVILLLQANLLFVNGYSFNSVEVPRLRLYTLGLWLVIGAWVVFVIGALLPAITTLDSRLLLPPLERAAVVLSVVVFAWVFLRGHDDAVRFSILFWLMLLAIVIGLVATIVSWETQLDEIAFTETLYHQLWMAAGIGISLIAGLLTLISLRTIPDGPLKIAFFLVVGVGFGISLIVMPSDTIVSDSDAPALLRLAYVIGLAIVPYIAFRLSQARLQEVILTKLKARQATSRPVPVMPLEERDGARGTAAEPQPMQLLRALGLILQETDPEAIPRRVISAALETCHGDIAALIRLQDVNYADLTEGYNRSQKRKIPATSVNLKNQPTLVNAIERKTQRALYPDRNEIELEDLYTRLNIEHIGPIYFQPLLRDENVVAVLMLGLPYAQRELTNAEAELLNGFGIIASDLLQLSFEAKEARLQVEQRTIDAMLEGMVETSPAVDDEPDSAVGSDDLKGARQQINELTRQVMELKLKLDDERTRLANMLDASDETLTISQRIRAINEEQQRLREERDELRRRLKEAETAFSSVTTEDNRVVVDRIVAALQTEKDTLQAERERLQNQLDELRIQSSADEGADVQQMINRMIEERSRLEVERDQLSEDLLDIQSQLSELGIEEGTSGLAQLIGQLYEQRAELKERSDQLQRERDALLNERKNIEGAIERERERDEQIANLQSQIENLAIDRDALTRQLDKLRAEQTDYQEKLDAVKDHRARLLAQTSGLELELSEATAEQAQLRAEIQNLANERNDLVSERDRLLAESRAVQTERDQLLARAEGNRTRFQEMSEQGVGSLKEMIDDLTEQRSQLERQLSDVRSRLADSEKQITRLQSQSTNLAMRETLSPEQSEMMVSLAQDLRTPMTSILGYLSLLLQESAGILGERQRNFLERIGTGVDRLEVMIQDLVQITALDTGRLKLQIEPVSVVQIIEDVMTDTFMQFREKSLALNLDLDDTMLPVAVDRAGLRTVIGQLLTNAYLVSPPGTEITIVAKQDAYRIREAEKLRECVFVSVTDQGGGIATDELEDVFRRRYKATNPLIAGLGDTGVGLAIAKAIIEAHHGRLWITVQEGVGSRLSFVIPIEMADMGFEEG